tara:strand:+ start:22 stop:756 length:735 start_codon:yes stop_codon:yes gene_type:complete
MISNIIDKNNEHFNKPCVIFDTNKFHGIKETLTKDGMIIFNSNLNDSFFDILNRKIINFVNIKNDNEIKIYNKEQKNRLKTTIPKSSNLYKDIENNFQTILDILSSEFNKKVNIHKINSDIALPGSNLQYPHWDNEEKNKKFFLTVPLITMDNTNGALEIWPCTNGIDKFIDKTKTENILEYSLVNMQFKNTFTEISDLMSNLKSYKGPFYKKQIIIRDSSTLHRGTINKSDEIRITLTIVLDI